MSKGILSRTYSHVLLIAILGVIVYSNTFHVPFLFDDESSITDNPVIRSLEGFLSGAGYNYNPRRFIGYLTIALNYRLGGLDVTGYHIFNLAVHISAACLVYALVRLTFRTPFFEVQRSTFNVQCSESPIQNSKFKTQNSHSPFTIHHSLISLFAALLFVCHPVQTQAVTYIIQRLASLATMFFLLSLILYVMARLGIEARGTGRESSGLKNRGEGETTGGGTWLVPALLYAGSLLSAVLAMKTKEIAFTLPLVAALYEVFFFKGKAGRRLLILLPMLLTIAIVPLSMMDGGKPAGELLSDLSEKYRADTAMTRWDYLITQLRVIVTYLRILILPMNQNLDYDYPLYHSFFAQPVLLSFLFLVALIGFAVYLFISSRPAPSALRLVSFGLLWFFITLSVESSVIPIADVIFEHRLYLPSAGIFIAVAASLGLISDRSPAKFLITFSALVVLLFSAAAWKRNLVWGDGLTLWRDTVSKSHGKDRPHNNLGGILSYQGRPAEALEQFDIAIRLNPDYADAYNNRGVAYDNMGLPDKAVENFQLAIKLSPELVNAYYNLGAVYGRKGMSDKAIEMYGAALRLNPGYADAHNNLGAEYGAKGLIDKAVEHIESAIRIKPEEPDFHVNLAHAYAIKGWKDKAMEQERIAEELREKKRQ